MENDDFDIKQFDQDIHKLLQKIKADGIPERVVDEERVKEFEAAYLSLKLATNAKVIQELSPDKSYGLISIRGKNILIKAPEVLRTAFETATNFEIASNLAGMTELNLMYYGLKKAVKN